MTDEDTTGMQKGHDGQEQNKQTQKGHCAGRHRRDKTDKETEKGHDGQGHNKQTQQGDGSDGQCNV